MLLEDLLESINSKKLVCIYGGRFQPFHRGHYQVFLWLCKKFGKGNVWIATSDKTNFDEKLGDISPFTFKEKQEIITTLYDIEPRRIVQCKNPTFNPTEIFKQYRGFDIVYVAAVGTKDVDRYKDSTYFEPLPYDLDLPGDVDKLTPLSEKQSYYVKVPMKRDGISGTEVRKELTELEPSDTKAVKKAFLEYFGKYDPVIADLVMARLKDVR